MSFALIDVSYTLTGRISKVIFSDADLEAFLREE
jgi:hypothetical protein